MSLKQRTINYNVSLCLNHRKLWNMDICTKRKCVQYVCLVCNKIYHLILYSKAYICMIVCSASYIKWFKGRTITSNIMQVEKCGIILYIYQNEDKMNCYLNMICLRFLQIYYSKERNESLMFNKFILRILNHYKCSQDILDHQTVRASSVIYVAS